MFRKLWRTLKFFIILGIVLLCLPRSILPVQSSGKEDLDYYIRKNNEEQRLGEYKDDVESLKIKLKQLELINKSRRHLNSGPVKLDILASRVANRMAKEAAENNFLGHYNLAGEKPYHRYAFAGGNDHVSENAYGEWSSDNYSSSPSDIAEKMKKGHEIFMAEKPPYDGHRQNIADKSHNYVGIGYWISGKQFRYYEEFIDRYLEFEDIPAETKINEKAFITVKTEKGSYLYYLIAYREGFPEPMTPGQINSKGSYDDFTGEQYLRIPAWDLASFREGSRYRIPLKFTKEGLYYIQIYTDKKEISSPSSVNTKGKTPVSGIVIKVTR